jgi:sugar/nucleoside kinase (ribokinase family)
LRLGLLGKKYIDTLYFVKTLNEGETNTLVSSKNSLGGMYNIVNANLLGITPVCYPEGETSAIILEDKQKSKRTSFVESFNDRSIRTQQSIKSRHPDWIHVMYIDDIKSPHRVTEYHNNFRKFPVSIDFCTNTSREKFIPIMERCEIIFDSRERKHLYENFEVKTPIVLHDPLGCELIFNGKKIIEAKNKKLKLNVNGAGDIFAALFLRELQTYDLNQTINRVCDLTTQKLLEMNSEKI